MASEMGQAHGQPRLVEERMRREEAVVEIKRVEKKSCWDAEEANGKRTV